jgi:dephospho-CoA kinase
MIVIGITGTLGAGKGTVVDYLVTKYGFKHYSAPDFIRQEVLRRGLPDNRDSMRVVGNDLRKEHGAGFLVNQAYAQAQTETERAVIESLRSTREVTTLKTKPGTCVLWGVDADPQIRYERIIKRKSHKDNVTFEKFLQEESKEMNDTSPNGMSLSQCLKMADVTIYNNGDLAALQQQVDQAIAPLLK